MKRGFSRKNFLNLSNLVSIVSRERKREIKKSGRKLIKYLEVIKWLISNNLEKRNNPPIGRMKEAKRTRAFFLCLEKKGNRINKIIETIINGPKGTQS